MTDKFFGGCGNNPHDEPPASPPPANGGRGGFTADLRLGRWQDVLGDMECDALIVDAPYSERTHAGMRTGPALTGSGNPYVRTGVVYDRWSEGDVVEFVQSWSDRVSGWFVSITDHVLGPVFERELSAMGRYTFAPLPFLEMGKQPRLGGDGPASWTCWIIVARPKTRTMQHWGSLPGGYCPPKGIGVLNDRLVKGGKPMWLMNSLVRDYTRPGDLVCDPCAGGGTTLLAALTEGRRAVGAEMDPKHHAIAKKRLAKGYTPPLFADTPPTHTQLKIGDDE